MPGYRHVVRCPERRGGQPPGVHPFLVTLGTMGIFRGLAFVTTRAPVDRAFRPLVRRRIHRTEVFRWGEANPFRRFRWSSCWWYSLRNVVPRPDRRGMSTQGGRRQNETAARYAGLDIARLKGLAYALCGLTAGIAAMINIGYHGSAASSDGAGYELEV